MEIKKLLRRAYKAALSSNDKSTTLGALLVGPDKQVPSVLNHSVVVQACNLMPWEFAGKGENHLRPRKYQLTEHAERAVIYRAARCGIRTQGLALVCPLAACSDCARAIVLAGISKVVIHKQAFDRIPERWIEECEVGLELLREGNVDFEVFDGKIGGVESLMDGETWLP